MDNKQNFYSRQGSNKVLISESRKSDITQNKPLPRNSKRRENSNNNNIFKNDQRFNKQNNNNNKFRSNGDKRPKPRSSFVNSNGNPANVLAESISSPGLVDDSEEAIEYGDDCEFENGLYQKGSIASGSKKQNLNHLLNFHYVPYETLNGGNGLNVFGKHNSNRGYVKRQKYNKEQYLQANFQFVVKKSAEPFIDISNPDCLIDWEFIEQINIQTTEEPQCPICLYPPIAAKLTRCGHVYCWPCILHYLALSEKTWRKCPICYEAIHTKDLKSTSIIQQKNFKMSDLITFQLMRRKKGSIFAEKCPDNEKDNFLNNIPYMNHSSTENIFSKFLIADLAEIIFILDREYKELQNENDSDCPETMFVRQALDLLEERKTGVIHEQRLRAKKGNEVKLSLNVEKSNLFEEDTHLISICQSIIEHLELNENGKEAISGNICLNDDLVEIKENDHVNVGNVETKEIDKIIDLGAIKKEKFYYFYQSTDGQNVFLHPLNVKMLQTMHGTLDKGPKIIESKILQKEFYSMNEDVRKKFTCLGHLPLTCQFEIVEVNLQPPIISDYVLKYFKDDILLRQKARTRRDREEKKREKRINEFNDRQMGKFIATSANIDIGSVQQFPTCGFEESLSSNSYEESTIRAYDLDLADSPPPSLTNSSKRNKSTTSFATILSSPKKETWPTLISNVVQNDGIPWNKNTSTAVNKTANISTREIWTSENELLDEISIPRKSNLSDVVAEAFEMKKKQNNSDTVATNQNSGKKGKKGKKTLLFSTGMSFSGN